jgi:hypothetical protein
MKTKTVSIRVRGLTQASKSLLERYLGPSVRVVEREGEYVFTPTTNTITFRGAPVPIGRNPLHERLGAVAARTIANHHLRRTVCRPEPLERIDPALALKLQAKLVCDGEPLRREHVPPGTVIILRRKRYLVVGAETIAGKGVCVRTVPPSSAAVLTGKESQLRLMYPVPAAYGPFLESKLRLLRKNPRLRAYLGGTLLQPSERSRARGGDMRELFTKELPELQQLLRKAGGLPPVRVRSHEPIQEDGTTISIDETRGGEADVQLFPICSKDGRWRLVIAVDKRRTLTLVDPHMAKGAPPLRVTTKDSGYRMETDPTKKRRKDAANRYVADTAMRVLSGMG